MNPEQEIIVNMLVELATELDMHYDDEEFFALTPTIEKMQRAVTYLSRHGIPCPQSVTHVFNATMPLDIDRYLCDITPGCMHSGARGVSRSLTP